MEKTNETWKRIPGFPRYEISDQGRVKSYTSPLYPEGKIKKLQNRGGYTTVHLMRGTQRTDNDSKTCQVHRLLAEVFIPVPDELSGYTMNELQVDHIVPIKNGGKSTLSNLRWCTVKQNANNEITKINRARAVDKRKKMVYQYDEDLNLVATYDSTRQASNILGKSQGNITSCATGALPRYLGYIFSYEPLWSLEERKELEDKMKYQFDKNRQSTYKAMNKWVAKKKENGEPWNWYQRHPDDYKVWWKKYYAEHRDHILQQQKARRNERQQKEDQTKMA